jgi:hypothetical protein
MSTTSTVQTVTLTNLGRTTISIAGIIIGTKSGDFSQINACGKSLAAGATCTLDLMFKPTAKGARTGALSLSDNSGGSPQKISLSGTDTWVSPLS